MDLLRSLHTHEVRFEGRSIPVPQPSVRTALTLIHAAEGSARGEADMLHDFSEAARSWLPRVVCRRLFPRGLWKLLFGATPPALAVSMTMQLFGLGQAAPGARSDTAEKGQKADEIEWSKLLAEYAHVYGIDPLTVLETPWHFFLQMLLAVDSVHAKGMLRTLTVKGIPHIDDDKERDAALKDLQQRAGGASAELSEEEKLEEQRANLTFIKRRFFGGQQ